MRKILESAADRRFESTPAYKVQSPAAPPAQTPRTSAESEDQHAGSRETLLFYFEECSKEVNRKDFVLQMPYPTVHYNKQEEIRRSKRLKNKRDADANRTIDVATETSQTAVKNQENEFSDQSDMEYGFGPLPESVFEAIEDTRDSQRSDGAPTPDVEHLSEESDESNPPPDNNKVKNTYKKKPRTCPICSRVYTASSSYFYHMRYTHKNVKEHECQICAKKFATKASLMNHSTTHSDERVYECKQCKKRFRSKPSLYIHEKLHNGIKNWSCTQCERRFEWKTHLLRHMKRHTKEKNHICSTCGRGFHTRSDMLRHARTHLTKKIACDKCDVKFAQPRYLRVHMKKKHGRKSPTNSNS